MVEETKSPQTGVLGSRFLKCGAKILLAFLKQIPGVGMAAELLDEGMDTVKELKDEQEHHTIQERLQQLEEAMQYNGEQARAIAKQAIDEARASGCAVSGEKEAAVLDMMAAMPSNIQQKIAATMSHAKRKGTTLAVLPVDAKSCSVVEQTRFYQSLLPSRRQRYQAGQVVPNKACWLFESLLGLGGFGEVWKIKHKLLHQNQAIKLCLEVESSRILKQEAKTIAALQEHLSQHPHIVSVLDANVEDEPYWIAFEYIGGGTLESYIRSFAGPMPLAEALPMFAGICQGVQAAHELHIVHRDIKPANILLTPDHLPKIADFGLGKVMAEKEIAETTKRSKGRDPAFTLRGYGTARYMSPEQQDGNEADPSDDVYALGVTLYHMLVGNPTSDPRCFRPDLRKLATKPPTILTELLGECLELRRGERFANAGTLLTRFQEVCAESKIKLVAFPSNSTAASNAAQQELATLQEQCKTMEQQLANAQHELAQTQAQCEQQLTTAQQELSQTQAQTEKAKQNLAQTQSQVTTAKQELLQTQSQTEKAKRECSTVQQELSQTQAQIEKAKRECSTAQQELSQTQSQTEKAKQNLAQTQSQVTTAQQNLTQTQSQLATAQQELAQVQSQIETAKQSLLQVKTPATPKQSSSSPSDSSQLISDTNLWKECRFEQDGQWLLDMTQPAWTKLKYQSQIKFAKEYQERYATAYNKKPRAIYTISNVHFPLQLIPPGAYFIGSPDDEPERSSDEKQTRIIISQPFYLGETSVTQSQWKAVMGSNPSNFKGDTLPVETIYWKEAMQFCQTIAQKTGEDGFRLPTEFEWEYACRAGTTTPFNCGPNITSAIVNYVRYHEAAKEQCIERTVACGSLKNANAWSLADMHGNVWDWCLDQSGQDYSQAEQIQNANSILLEQFENDMQNPGSRVMRGGSWNGNAKDCRSAYRNYYSDRGSNLGCRLLKSCQ